MNAVVAFALKHRVLMVVLFVMMLAGGIMAFRALNIEAYPDPTPPMVDVITQSPGLSAEEMERYITIPIEVQMAGLPFVKSIRTISLTGLSDVKVQFTYDLSYAQAAATSRDADEAIFRGAMRKTHDLRDFSDMNGYSAMNADGPDQPLRP